MDDDFTIPGDSDTDIENSADDQSESIQRIDQQLRKWLDHYPDLIPEDQFTALVQKCGVIHGAKIVELFRSLDYQRTGTVSKDVLLQNNYLASLITVYSSFRSSSGHRTYSE